MINLYITHKPFSKAKKYISFVYEDKQTGDWWQQYRFIQTQLKCKEKFCPLKLLLPSVASLFIFINKTYILFSFMRPIKKSPIQLRRGWRNPNNRSLSKRTEWGTKSKVFLKSNSIISITKPLSYCSMIKS